MKEVWNMFRVGVKFCGNCNPNIETAAIYKELIEDDSIEYISANNPPYDALLILNGCKIACTKIPAFSGPIILLDEDTINNVSVPKSQMAGELKRIFHDFKEKAQKTE